MPVSELEAEESKKKRAERMEKISTKVHSLFWVMAAIGLIVFTDMHEVVFSDDINRLALNMAIMSFTANVGIFFYMSFWLPVITKVNVPWEIYCPNMIPIATGLGVFSMLALIVAFWPVWGFLSPLYVLVMIMGFIFSAHFIPWPC